MASQVVSLSVFNVFQELGSFPEVASARMMHVSPKRKTHAQEAAGGSRRLSPLLTWECEGRWGKENEQGVSLESKQLSKWSLLAGPPVCNLCKGSFP